MRLAFAKGGWVACLYKGVEGDTLLTTESDHKPGRGRRSRGKQSQTGCLMEVVPILMGHLDLALGIDLNGNGRRQRESKPLIGGGASIRLKPEGNGEVIREVLVLLKRHLAYETGGEASEEHLGASAVVRVVRVVVSVAFANSNGVGIEGAKTRNREALP